jgi:putative addiction module CopG family antidote
MTVTKHAITLGEREEAFVKAQVATGEFEDASAVIRIALQRLEQDEAELRALIMEGVRDIEEGRYREITSIDDFVQEIIDAEAIQSKRAG